MKLPPLIFSLGLLVFGANLIGKTNQIKQPLIPYLDEDSQSNVIVTVSDFFGDGQKCSPVYTNVLSNTNLFSLQEQRLIKDAFVIYTNVTTNSGPSGSGLTHLYKTNYVFRAMNRTFEDEAWVANFQYTNSDAHEEIIIGAGVRAKYRNKSNDGYDVSLTRTGGGTLLSFGEIKHDLPNGLLARFVDTHAQGLTWDYKLANFRNSHLVEYRQYSNGLVLGKFFMWHPQTGNLMIEAEFKEPYDFEKHRIKP